MSQFNPLNEEPSKTEVTFVKRLGTIGLILVALWAAIVRFVKGL